jgi:hypothetical protein
VHFDIQMGHQEPKLKLGLISVFLKMEMYLKNVVFYLYCEKV